MAKTVTAGSAPSFSASYNPATNNSGRADANGNQLYGPVDPSTGNQVQYSYDVENRTISAYENGGPSTGYGYDPQGKRVLVQTSGLGFPTSNGTPNVVVSSAFTFYAITGQRLSTFSVITSQYGNSGACSNAARGCMGAASGSWLYFGGRLISSSNGLPVQTDRLGSVRSGISYYPWGEEKTSPPTQDGQVEFGTYFRDMPGQDYADQRYYTATAGRFYTPDPSTGVDPKNPISWNKYLYAGDDPVNLHDPHGLMDCLASPDDGGCDPGDGGGGGPWWCSGNSLEPDPTCGGPEPDPGPDPGPDPTQTQPCFNWGCMPPALARAIQALTLNPNCFDLYGTPPTRQRGWNPETALTSLALTRDFANGSINFNYAGPDVAKTTPSGMILPSISNGITGSGATISLNPAYWNIDNVDFNAETLLHELGHLYDFTRGSGGFAVKNPAEITDPQAFDKLIHQDCGL